MSDIGDTGENRVHPPAEEEGQTEPMQEDDKEQETINEADKEGSKDEEGQGEAAEANADAPPPDEDAATSTTRAAAGEGEPEPAQQDDVEVTVEAEAEADVGGTQAQQSNLDDEEGFDPATLANLAALSRIMGDDEDDEGLEAGTEERDEADERATAGRREAEAGAEAEEALIRSERHEGPLTREQVQEFVNNLSARDKEKGGESGEGEGEADGDGERERNGDGAETPADEDSEAQDGDRDRNRAEEDDEGDDDEDKGRKDGDDEYEDGKPSEGGKVKRRRNRTTLVSQKKTYVYEQCPFRTIAADSTRLDAHYGQNMNIPCSRCIKRGVPGMCRMEHPILPQRKRRKVTEDVDINYELGLRVQALESLLRSGSMMDAESASAAARETIMHATRAANSGSQDANNALAQLTQSAAVGGGIGGMTQDAQSSLLLDVLQQLTAASMGRALNTNGNGDGSDRRGLDLWSSIPTASQETAVAITSAFDSDEVTNKINLSLPGFREDNGKLFVPPTVRYVEKNLRNDNSLARETLPVEGYAPFLDQGVRFAYGADSQAYRHGRISAIQAVSLTGALRLAATFLSRFPSSSSTRAVYVPSPTADEDTTALQDAGLEIRSFRYLDLKTGSVDWESLREDLQAAPPKSIVLLQVSGSMPTGAELTTNQWRLLATLLQERELIPLVMMAFQGLSTGDTNRDAQALRFMVHEGLPVVLVQCFDAMMGLYAESPAIVSLVTQNIEDKERVDSQLRAVARGMWYHPSPWGAFVAHQILSDPKLHPAWLAEIKAMADRLRSVREKLYDLLANKLKTPGTWFHVKRASGMYCTALIPPSQVEALTAKRHVHLLPDGCFNLGCLNAPKIDILARAIDSVVRDGIKEMEEQQAQRLAMEMALAAAKAQQLREEAELQAAAEAAEAEAAREEDTLLMERSIANAIEAQKRAEEEEKKREEERKVMDEREKKARERAEIARQAELILATI